MEWCLGGCYPIDSGFSAVATLTFQSLTMLPPTSTDSASQNLAHTYASRNPNMKKRRS
ncbi:hypothetical protein J0S82_012530, partial [Galemys pyrenaicus]